MDVEYDERLENWAGVIFASVRKEIKDERVVATIVREVLESGVDSISDMLLKARRYTLNYLKCGSLSH